MTYQYIEEYYEEPPKFNPFMPLTMLLPQKIVTSRKFVNLDLQEPKADLYNTLEKHYPTGTDWKDEMANFLGVENGTKDTGIIGPWNENLIKDAKTYYYISFPENNVYRFFIFEAPDTIYMTNHNGKIYCIENNNSLMSVTPEPGDLICDNMQEAISWLEKFKKQQEEIITKERIMQRPAISLSFI